MQAAQRAAMPKAKQTKEKTWEGSATQVGWFDFLFFFYCKEGKFGLRTLL